MGDGEEAGVARVLWDEMRTMSNGEEKEKKKKHQHSWPRKQVLGLQVAFTPGEMWSLWEL